MIELKFKCTLLTDVILNQKSATEGSNQTLDFIPGNNFLGIVAGSLYGKLDSEVARLIFHSSKVRFGDAHPACGNHRTLHVPASLYCPKIESGDKTMYYVHHCIPDPSADELRKAQLKQQRKGFIDYCPLTGQAGHGIATKVPVTTGFVIKSAYDRERRRSKDEQLFCFESIDKGHEFFFKVEVDDSLEGHASEIKETLTGIRRIGRSRSAQYGQVEIEYCPDYEESVSSVDGECKELVVYADSRLILLDDKGMPMVELDRKTLFTQLGIPDVKGTILWDKCQIGVFKYAPYNYRRSCYDAERYGFEKGSVWVLRLEEPVSISGLNDCIGAYQNEGFGKVIYNPLFLQADKYGKVTYDIIEHKVTEAKDKDEMQTEAPDTALVRFIAKRKEEAELNTRVYDVVDTWVNKYASAYQGDETFAAQWGAIRNLAIQYKDYEGLKEALFAKGKGYLVHGVAKEKWSDKLKSVEKFLADNKGYAVAALINLAEVMQKLSNISKKKKHGK